jgi:membrane fusion protein, multidrug efflux system
MKKISLLLAALALMVACSSNESKTESVENTPVVKQEENLVRIVNVNAETIVLKPFTSYIRLIGEVKAMHDVKQSAEVSGKLLSYSVKEGQFVKAGDVVGQIDDEMLKKDVERMEAIVSATRENYERLKLLWSKDSIGSEINYLNAKYAYDQNKASLDQLKIQLRKTKLVANISGVVETQFVKAGEMVIAGTPVFRLISTGKVKVEVGVPANYAGVIKKGEEGVVSFDAFPDKEFKTAITFVASSIQTQSRTFKVELELDNETNDLKVDMVANVILETNRFDRAIVVNQEYVYRTENGYEVFVVGKDDKGHAVAKRQFVTLGPGFDNKVVVKNGLESGDKLITIGSGDVENMTRILVVSNDSSMASSN